MFYHSLFYQTTKLIMEEDILNFIHQLSCFVGHTVTKKNISLSLKLYNLILIGELTLNKTTTVHPGRSKGEI